MQPICLQYKCTAVWWQLHLHFHLFSRTTTITTKKVKQNLLQCIYQELQWVANFALEPGGGTTVSDVVKDHLLEKRSFFHLLFLGSLIWECHCTKPWRGNWVTHLLPRPLQITQADIHPSFLEIVNFHKNALPGHRPAQKKIGWN